MEQELFARHTALADKLISFGFIKKGKDFFYQEAFHGGLFARKLQCIRTVALQAAW